MGRGSRPATRGHGVGLDPEAAPRRQADPPGAGEPPGERREVQQGRGAHHPHRRGGRPGGRGEGLRHGDRHPGAPPDDGLRALRAGARGAWRDGPGPGDREGLRPGARRARLGRVRGGAGQLLRAHAPPGGARRHEALAMLLLRAPGALGLQRGALDAADVLPRGRPARPGGRRPDPGGESRRRPSASSRTSSADSPTRPSTTRPSTISRGRSSSAANGGRDYRQAAAHLDRLLREYPTSRYAAGRPGPAGSRPGASSSRGRPSSIGCSSA